MYIVISVYMTDMITDVLHLDQSSFSNELRVLNDIDNLRINTNELLKSITVNAKRSYLIKIDDEWKLINCNGLKIGKKELSSLLKLYYGKSEIDIQEIELNNVSLISKITKNSFLNTTNISEELLQTQLKELDKEFINLELIKNRVNDLLNLFNINPLCETAIKNKDIPTILPTDRPIATRQHEPKLKKYVYIPTKNNKNSSLIDDTYDESISDTDDNNVVYEKGSQELNKPIINKPEMFLLNDELKLYEYNKIFSNNYFKVVGSNHYAYESDLNYILDYNLIQTENTTLEPYNIYFNSQLNNMVIIKNGLDFIEHYDEIKNIFPELLKVSSLSLTLEQYNNIQNLTTQVFIDVKSVEEKIKNIIDKKNSEYFYTTEDITKLLFMYFNIDTSSTKTMRFSNIFQVIQPHISITQLPEDLSNYGKRILSNVLRDLRLKKKRLSDGIHWIGISLKENNEVKQVNKNMIDVKIKETKMVTDDEYDNLLKERESSLKEIKKSKNFMELLYRY